MTLQDYVSTQKKEMQEYIDGLHIDTSYEELVKTDALWNWLATSEGVIVESVFSN